MIEIGKRYSKYSELCKAMNEEIQSGKRLSNQVDRWQRDYEIVKDSAGGYTIKKEYNEEEKLQMSINRERTKQFAANLAKVLSRSDDSTIVISPARLLAECQFVNRDYQELRYNYEQCAEILDTETYYIEEFSERSYLILKENLDSMIKQLEKARLINFEKAHRAYVLTNSKKEYKPPMFIEFGSQIDKEILEIERQVLVDMGIDSIQDVYKNKQRTNEFRRRTNIAFCSKYPQWDGYSTVYHICMYKDGLIKYYEDTEQSMDKRIKALLLESSQLKDIEPLDKLVEATTNPSRPYKILEHIKSHQ